MDPISIAILVAGSKILPQILKPVEDAVVDHMNAKKRAEEEEKKRRQQALETEARKLGCTVAELPIRRKQVARAKELGCTLANLPQAEADFQKRQAFAREWEQRVAREQEEAKRRWVEDQMKK
jgi:hypothetical protein